MSKERRVWAIVPAAGSGRRFNAGADGGTPKQYAELLGRSVLDWTLRTFIDEPRVHAIVVVLPAEDARWPRIAGTLDSSKLLTARGGALRQDSVMSALQRLEGSAAPEDWIMVHDAARPCLSREDIQNLLDRLAGDELCEGAVLAAPIVDTVKRERPDGTDTVDRQGLWRALTPQVFKYAALYDALRTAARAGITVTDEAQAMERMGVRAALVPGSPFNIKVTRAADLSTASEILRMRSDTNPMQRMRIGQGVDVHAFGAGDHVVLGGVRIAYGKGVIAHSDGDVVIHALCDALLGALGQGDIGQHFPDTDPRYRGTDSRAFLRSVALRMRSAGFGLINADVTVLAEAPRVNPHRAEMAAKLSEDLGVSSGAINIKATTTEKLGFIGRTEGLAAMATVLLG